MATRGKDWRASKGDETRKIPEYCQVLLRVDSSSSVYQQSVSNISRSNKLVLSNGTHVLKLSTETHGPDRESKWNHPEIMKELRRNYRVQMVAREYGPQNRIDQKQLRYHEIYEYVTVLQRAMRVQMRR